MKVSRHTGITYKDTELVIEAFLSILKASWLSGEGVTIRGLGSFVLKKFAAKKGRDIRRNVMVPIPAGMKPVFQISKSLKKTTS